MRRPADLPEPQGRLEIPGFAIGHGTDLEGKTGVTVILCPDGAVAAADTHGTATGTRQFDSLTRLHGVASRIHALVLAGGSGFGLSAADEVVRRLEAAEVGLDTGRRRLPLVPTAILFDLAFGDPRAQPDAALVGGAFEAAAGGEVPCGSVGAGTGATVGKALGTECAMKGGFGFASLTAASGLTVAGAVAVNAFGDIRDPRTGAIVAGCRLGADSRELAGADRVLAGLPADSDHPWERNTTLAVVLTDAELDRGAARKVSEMAFGGLHRTVLPACGLYDGDLVATLALGRRPAHVHQVGVLAQRAVEHAVLRAVREADGFGLLPAVGDLEGR